MEVRVVSFTPERFTPREIVRVTHGTGGWVGSSAGLDVSEKIIFLLLPGIEPLFLGRPTD
jgi:hypothetical protein